MVGQVAVYTLNLILLRTYLAGQPYVLDEPSLDAHPRPWDRLTGLWRSWFPLESLGALASRFSATREGTSLTLASEQGLFVAPDSSLHTVFNVAIALADNLTAATAGLHVMSLTVWPERSFFDALLTRFTDETRALDIIAQSMESRLYAGPLSAAVRRAVTGCFSEEPVIALDLADVGDRLVLSPRDRDLTWRAPDSVRELPRLSRYAAELAAHSRAELDAHWLDWSLLDPHSAPHSDRQGWERFLASPAAAPVLRVAMRQLTAAQCARFARILRNQSLDRLFSPYDVDTAAALAVLAWRGEDSRLCLGWIDVILQQCSRRDWSPLDIPLGTWDGLADLFRTADPLFARARERFAALVDVDIESAQHDQLAAPLATGQPHLIEFWIQALRIGVTQTRGSIVQAVIPVVTRENAEFSGYTRRWFLLLLRWARESSEAQLITNVLFGRSAYDAGAWWTHFGAEGPEAIDLDRACQDLTYREAMDLRWALALQQPPASADQNRGPRPALFPASYFRHFRLAISAS